MHDEVLERRLRATLREDARQLPFTITASELERRLVLRHRSLGGRRLGLLLAAAVGIGLFGIGGAMGGLFDDPTPSLPAPSPVAEASGPVPTPSPHAPPTLPSLDEMLAEGDPATVVLAQAHGPDGGPDPDPADVAVDASSVYLGTMDGSSGHEIAIGCLSASGIEFFLGTRLSPNFEPDLVIDCDGSVRTVPVTAGVGPDVWLAAPTHASWRVVVRRVDGTGPEPGGEPTNPELVEGREELARLEDQAMDDGLFLPGTTGLAYTHAGDLPAREGYYVQVSCAGGPFLRYIFGDEIDGELVGLTTTQVACDGGIHDGTLRIAQPFGSRLFVAAEPGTRWSLLVSGDQPPVSLVQSQPGWQLSSGFGPNLEFETIIQSFTGVGQEGGGPILIAVSCAGTGTIQVVVRLEHANQGQVTEDTYAQFDAQCEPGGATTSQSFATADAYVDVEWTAPAGTWVAVGILVPDPLPEP